MPFPSAENLQNLLEELKNYRKESKNLKNLRDWVLIVSSKKQRKVIEIVSHKQPFQPDGVLNLAVSSDFPPASPPASLPSRISDFPDFCNPKFHFYSTEIFIKQQIVLKVLPIIEKTHDV